jgi:hypothetical protein
VDADISLALNFVLLGAPLLGWFVDAIQESRRGIRKCEASGGHYWQDGHALENRAFPHRSCTRCRAHSAGFPDEVERI